MVLVRWLTIGLERTTGRADKGSSPGALAHPIMTNIVINLLTWLISHLSDLQHTACRPQSDHHWSYCSLHDGRPCTDTKHDALNKSSRWL
eukprot:3527082-Pleurochrysis_carterae.AAC.1